VQAAAARYVDRIQGFNRDNNCKRINQQPKWICGLYGVFQD
jgi:hypothetical protein